MTFPQNKALPLLGLSTGHHRAQPIALVRPKSPSKGAPLKAFPELAAAKMGRQNGAHGGKGAPRQRNKALASAQRREQRARQIKLVMQLDSKLPVSVKGRKCVNGAGGRSVGTEGRSLQNVLADAIEHVRNLRAGSTGEAVEGSKAHVNEYPNFAPLTAFPSTAWGASFNDSKQGVILMTSSVFKSAAELDMSEDGSIFRRTIQSSYALAHFEVAMPGWTVTSVNPGARTMFRNCPFIEIVGQCLLNGFVHEQDIGKLERLWEEACASSACRTQRGPLDASPDVPAGPDSSSGVKGCRAQATCSGGGSPSARARLRLLSLGVGLQDQGTQTCSGHGAGTHSPAAWTSTFCAVDATMVMMRQSEVGPSHVVQRAGKATHHASKHRHHRRCPCLHTSRTRRHHRADCFLSCHVCQT